MNDEQLRKIVVAADSFKGSLSSAEVAEAVALGVREVFPECEVVCLDVADGGEGTMEALLKALGGAAVECEAHDPLMHPLRAEYGISADGGTAIIDMAAASGLTLLREDERNPMLTTTFGTGEMVAHALRSGCRRVIIGLGGSATNDGGTGMLPARADPCGTSRPWMPRERSRNLPEPHSPPPATWSTRSADLTGRRMCMHLRKARVQPWRRLSTPGCAISPR